MMFHTFFALIRPLIFPLIIILVFRKIQYNNVKNRAKNKNAQDEETSYAQNLKYYKDREKEFKKEAKKSNNALKKVLDSDNYSFRDLKDQTKSLNLDKTLSDLEKFLEANKNAQNTMAGKFVKNFLANKVNKKAGTFDNKAYLKKVQEEKKQTEEYYKDLEKKEEAYRFDTKKEAEVLGQKEEAIIENKGDLNFLDSDLANAVVLKEILDKPLSLR